MRPYKAQWSAWQCPVAACSTTSGMVMQWPGWRCDGGDDRTGLMATEVTPPAGLTSRRRPVRAQSSRASSLRGFRRPFSRVRCAGRTGVSGYSAAGRLLTTPHSVAQWQGVGGAVAGHDSQARSGVDSHLTLTLAGVSALNAPAGGACMGAAARDALERDGNSLEGAFGPRSRRGLMRGGV
jgi:hypothetical protein